VRDNWGPPSFAVHLKTDPDRANISGVSNLDVAGASSTAMNGHNLTVLRDGDEQIPIVARIVLFDFIEEMHAKGEPLEEALLDAGIVRLRPVLITVAATSSRSSRSPPTGARCGSRCATRRLAG
jgi:multidrug efflux pump subunit AcrB